MKDKGLIPKGLYCYDENLKKCPYWRIIKEREEQENAWCDYLGKGDVEIIAEKGYKTRDKDGKIIEGLEMGFSFLWDQCKYCGVNEGFEDEEFIF